MEIVYTLYRVSTKKQVDKMKDDIPMQREACHEFADRIGRIDDETPLIVEWFVKQGVKVWSVQEGEQRLENHVDKLKYLCYHNSRGLCECDGQSSYLAYKVDEAVCSIISDMFSNIKNSPDEKVLKKHFSKEMQSFKSKQTKIKHDLSKLEKQHEKLEGEIAKTLTGESVFSSEQLSKVIKSVEEQMTEQQDKLDTLNTEMTEKKNSMKSIKPLYDSFKSWSEEF